MRVMCLAQEHNTMSSDSARTRTACSRDERTDDEATAEVVQETDEWPKKFTDKMVFLFNNLNKILLQTFDVSCAIISCSTQSSDVFPQINNS